MTRPSWIHHDPFCPACAADDCSCECLCDFIADIREDERRTDHRTAADNRP